MTQNTTTTLAGLTPGQFFTITAQDAPLCVGTWFVHPTMAHHRHGFLTVGCWSGAQERHIVTLTAEQARSLTVEVK